MKNDKRIFFYLLFIINILFSCGTKKSDEKEKSTTNGLDYKNNSELVLEIKKEIFKEEDCNKCATISLIYPYFQGQIPYLDDINAFISELLLGNMIYSENVNEDIKSYADSFFKYYKKYKDDEKSSLEEKTWSLDVTIQVLYNNNNIITIKSIKSAQENLDAPIKSIFVLSLRYSPDMELISIKDSTLKLEELKDLLLNKFMSLKNISKDSNLVEHGYWEETLDVPEFVGVFEDKFLFTYDYNELGPKEKGYTEFYINFDELGGLVDFAKLGL